MNINFLSRCLIKNHYKYNLHRLLIQTERNFASCTCDLTSNSFIVKNNVYQSPKRYYCNTGGPPAKRLPPLMNFPEIVWPSIIKSLRNFILTTFIIRPYFDREFNLPDFVAGSKKAVEVVSSKLSEGDLNTLDNLIDKKAITDLQKSVSLMSMSQRQQIQINQDDIYFSFPYQIGVMFDDEDQKPQKRFVEITMVYHIFKGLEGMKNRGEDLPLNVGMLPQYRENISICNYRFIREFTKGVESDWTVNLLNHFKPSDYIDQ